MNYFTRAINFDTISVIGLNLEDRFSSQFYNSLSHLILLCDYAICIYTNEADDNKIVILGK